MDNTKLKGRMSGKVQELQQPTGNQAITVTSAPETSLAPVDSTYLALTSNALDIIRANLKSQPLTLDLFDLVKSPSGGATVFEVPGLAGTEAAMELSTKNAEKKRDPEMHQTKKGNQWHFGMKCHTGVDAGNGFVHTVEATAANVHDVTVAAKLLQIGRASCRERV